MRRRLRMRLDLFFELSCLRTFEPSSGVRLSCVYAVAYAVESYAHRTWSSRTRGLESNLWTGSSPSKSTRSVSYL